IILPTLMWTKITSKHILLILMSTLWMGAIGFLDDYLKVIKKYPPGLIAKYKMIGQMV
ncbi:MAG: phospho-N-acetylmuramoyl-pentapeptide-transferase, partial [Legionellales bacterium]|nr:phospho-N-acetylmuramoyl-pentapeptide-transferase [Legionellales bacterium]